MDKPKTGNTKVINPDVQYARAKRLKRIYNSKKDELGLSLRKLAPKLGMNHSAVGQYINGDIPLNFESACKFAKILKCEVYDIDPDFLQVYEKAMFTQEPQYISVIGSLSGRLPKDRLIKMKKGERSSVALELDADVLFPIEKKDYAILNPSCITETGYYAIRMRDDRGEFRLCCFKNTLPDMSDGVWELRFSPEEDFVPINRDSVSFLAAVVAFI